MKNAHSHKSGYIALIGRPNAGKSTLLNQILGQKLVAVTPRPQTTRHRIFGIFDRDDVQIVFQDTPGLLDPNDAMHEFMMREAQRALEDSDAAVWLIDAIKGITKRERTIAEKQVSILNVPIWVVFNKIDKTPLDQRARLADGIAAIDFSSLQSIEYISALHGDGVNSLLEKIVSFLPQGPKFYPSDQISDRAQRFFIEEIVREQAFLLLRQEIPYSLAVQIEKMHERKDGLTDIHVVLHVERKTQKGILVGKSGSMIKKIGTHARQEIEKMTGNKVFLKLWVKVSDHWRKRGDRLKEFGYTD